MGIEDTRIFWSLTKKFGYCGYAHSCHEKGLASVLEKCQRWIPEEEQQIKIMSHKDNRSWQILKNFLLTRQQEWEAI